MGYAHYTHQRRAFTDDEWRQFTHADLIDLEGHGQVRVTEDFVRVNGVGMDSWSDCTIYRNPAYYDEHGEHFEAHTTQAKPYDETVVNMLKLARKYCSGIRLSSDGYDVFTEEEERYGGLDARIYKLEEENRALRAALAELRSP